LLPQGVASLVWAANTLSIRFAGAWHFGQAGADVFRMLETSRSNR
jgi:hypothetical protein